MNDTVSEILIDPASPPEMPPPWNVIEFTFSKTDNDSELVVMCNGRCFIIQLFADTLSESLRDQYLFVLRVAENYELGGLNLQDFWDWAVEPLIPLFRAVTPEDKARQPTLDDFLFPKTFVYTLRAVSGKLLPEGKTKNHAAHVAPRFGIPLADEICAPWAYFRPSEILICQNHVLEPPSQTPGKVLLKDGSVAFIKLMRHGDNESLRNELDNYKMIDDARLGNSLRVSRLRGLVRDESGLVFGLLLTYIHCKFVTLSYALKAETPPSLQQKWATQLRDIIDQLHDAGIVWGDAKPDNVLIDTNLDAWVVDFGGGYTEGWVPKKLAGTMEGDQHALEKIVEFIGTMQHLSSPEHH
ncbi:hypothetical protein ACJ41O_001586 [Fusarium nematophilum]